MRWGGLQREVSLEKPFSTTHSSLNHTKITNHGLSERPSWQLGSVLGRLLVGTGFEFNPPSAEFNLFTNWGGGYPKQSADALNPASSISTNQIFPASEKPHNFVKKKN